MTQGGFYQQKRASPTSLTIVILLHGAAITALLMAKMTYDPPAKVPPTVIESIPIPKDPPPIPPEPDTPVPPQHQTVIDWVPPKVPPKPVDGPVVDRAPIQDLIIDRTPPGKGEAEPQRPVAEPPVAPSIRKEAVMDSRSQLQPPYPISERDSGVEGTVAIRVTIALDGRVRSVEKVRATNDAFFRATERHVLRNWKFKPATVDGRPVEARKTFSLKFELNG